MPSIVAIPYAIDGSRVVRTEIAICRKGPLRSTAYLAVKRSEAAHFALSTDPYYECFHHFTKI